VNLQEAHNFLNFWINKHTGGWYSPDELDDIIDRGQMSYFSDLILKYGTSQRLRDSLSPFKESYAFTTGDTPGGVITIPDNKNFLYFLDGYVTFTDSNYTFPQREIVFPNEDERVRKLQSQIDPVTTSSPLGEWIGDGVIQLYPQSPNIGRLNFYRRPLKPNFVYSVISGRVIVYDSGLSQNLEWKEGDHTKVLLKSLSHMGINLREEDVMQWAETKNQQNAQNFNKT